ncbi:MAG: hypothetical protein D3910_12160, partial [Candidatus Electrothrix sp. ATG2]|nr:hypothetical protein [Candidatus Electrothrix sp. ATG2]
MAANPKGCFAQKIITGIIWLSALILGAAGCTNETPEKQKGSQKNTLHPMVAVGSQWYGHIPVWVGID